METKVKTVEQVLEEGGERFGNIVALYEWSLNYEAGRTPFTLFIDLIGYSESEFGSKVFDYHQSIYKTLGYMELDYLGDALKEYANAGESAYDFVAELMTAEAGE